MIELACNWSTALKNLIETQQIDVDYIKAGAYGTFENEFDTMRSLKPVLLHGLGYFEHTGMKNYNRVDFTRVNRLLMECGSPHYGLHMAIENADMTFPMQENEVHDYMTKCIQVFKNNLTVPLLLENTPDSPQEREQFDYFPYAEPEKMNELLTANDVGLLLDIAHAKITCQYRGWNIYDFLNALPLERIKEIHANGSGYDKNGTPTDTHQAMEQEDFELLAWVLQHASPDTVTLEYSGYGDEDDNTISENLYNQLNKLKHMCF